MLHRYSRPRLLYYIRRPIGFIASKFGISKDKTNNIFKFIKYTFRKAIAFFTYLFDRYKMIKPAEGNLLLIPGAFWVPIAQIKSAVNFVDSGDYIIPIIYDLIPFSFPQYCDDEIVKSFKKAFDLILPIGKGIITISKSTSDELKNYINNNNHHKSYNFKPSIDHFYLGEDIKSQNNDELKICDSLNALIRTSYFSNRGNNRTERGSYNDIESL